MIQNPNALAVLQKDIRADQILKPGLVFPGRRQFGTGHEYPGSSQGFGLVPVMNSGQRNERISPVNARCLDFKRTWIFPFCLKPDFAAYGNRRFPFPSCANFSHKPMWAPDGTHFDKVSGRAFIRGFQALSVFWRELKLLQVWCAWPGPCGLGGQSPCQDLPWQP